MRPAALFVVLTLAFVAARPPASLMDRALAAGTDGRLRLAQTEGSLWHGSGMVASANGDRGLRAWRPLEWRFSLALGEGGLALWLGEGQVQQARLVLTPNGVRLSGLDLDLPLGAVAAAIPQGVAHAGWRGDLAFVSDGIVCDWGGVCDGGLRVVWQHAGTDMVPEHRFGDYELALQLVAGNAALELGTLRGDIRLAGRGSIARGGQFSFNGTVEGDPEIVDRIPNVMDRNARHTETPGVVVVSLP